MSGYPGHPPPYPGTQPAGYAPPPAGYAPPHGYAPPAGYVPPPAPAASYYPTGSVAPPEAVPGYAPAAHTGYPSGYPAHPAHAPTWTAPAPVPSADRPPREQCFRIENVSSSLVLEVDGGSVDPNTRVITSYSNNGDGQLWFEDAYTGTIKSRLSLLCLHVNEYNCVVVRPYVPGDFNQQWLRGSDRVQNRQDPSKVMMLSSTGPGSNIMTTIASGDPRQIWRFPCGGSSMAGSVPASVPASYPAPHPAPRNPDGLGDMMNKLGKIILESKPLKPVVQSGATPQRYFYIVSEMHGKVLDVEGGSRMPGAKAIMWPRKGGANDNQLWYCDHNDVIHSKLTGFRLQGLGGGVSLERPTNQQGQMWIISGNRIVLKHSPGTCIDIIGEQRGDGAKVCQYQYKGSSNQHWRFEYLPPSYFVIRSQLHGKVLDVEGDNRAPGARVIMWPLKRPPGLNQQWYIDEQGVVHSRLNNFVLQPGGGGLGIVLMPNECQRNQQWTIKGQAIVLKSAPNKCLDIHSASRADGAKLCPYPLSNSPNQLWHFDFV